MSDDIAKVFRASVIEVLRNLADKAKSTPHGTLHWTTIDGIANDLEKLGAVPATTEVLS